MGNNTKKCATKLDILHCNAQDLDKFITTHVNEKPKETIQNFKETKTKFFDLPDCIQLQILHFLPYINLLYCRQVCTKLQTLVESALPLTKFDSVTIRISDNMDYRPWQLKKSKNKGLFSWPWKRKAEDCNSYEDNHHYLPKLKIKARKIIIERLITQLFDNHNTRLLNIVENVREVHFLGLVSGRNFQSIFEACPNVEIVHFNIASHGGPMDTPFRTLMQLPWKPAPKLRTVYEWPKLHQIIFDHSCEKERVEKISQQKYFSFSLYFNRGILTNRILCETPGIQVFTKPEWEAYNNTTSVNSEGMGLVILKRLNQDFYFVLHKELLKITLLVNILCLTPISLASILRDAYEIY